MHLNIIKRDGSTVPFNLDKIKKVIAWACEGLNVNPLLLESKVTAIFKEGISTRAIQDNLIQSAVTLTSIEEPYWKDVAGRLMMMNVWKETKLSRGYRYENSYEAILSKVYKGIYNNLLSSYTEVELQEACSWIDEKLDLNYDYAGMSVLANPNPNKAYLMKDELLQEAYLVQSLLLATVEKPQDKLYWAKQFYYYLSTKKISLATPFWTNLRRLNGSSSSCFIIELEDDLDSIYNGIHKVARISKSGGGVGISIGRIRAKGSWVNGFSKASNGVIPWIKVINDTLVAVDQGSKRAGAGTVALPSYHLDIEEFLEMQVESGGDLRRKCFDVFPQVICSDEFMRRVKADKDWTLFDPYEVKYKFNKDLADLWGEKFTNFYNRLESNLEGNGNSPNLKSSKITLWKKVKAKDIFKKIMKTQVETGLPYVTFKDTINETNSNKHKGVIPCTNLCIEAYHVVKADDLDYCCNLNSLNLANLTLEEIKGVAKAAVRMLDNSIDITHTPTTDANKHNDMFRTIGVGQMGLHDNLVLNNFNYSNGKEYISKLGETIGYYTIKASIELAKERGSYPAFKGSEFSKGIILGKVFYKNQYILAEELRQYYTEDNLINIINSEEKLEELFKSGEFQMFKTNLDWTNLSREIKQGIRNSEVTAIAPNTTTALIQGCTASILPVFSKFYMDKTSKGTVVNCPPYLETKFWYYLENKNTDQSLVIDTCSEIQKWTTSGISMELIFDLNKEEVDAKYIFDRLLRAWETKCKGIYYIRSIDKQKDPDKECSSCAS